MWKSVLYVDSDGLVRSGHLIGEGWGRSEEAAVVLSRTGEILGPGDDLALLALRAPTADERAALLQAVAAGYRVEET